MRDYCHCSSVIWYLIILRRAPHHVHPEQGSNFLDGRAEGPQSVRHLLRMNIFFTRLFMENDTHLLNDSDTHRLFYLVKTIFFVCENSFSLLFVTVIL